MKGYLSLDGPAPFPTFTVLRAKSKPFRINKLRTPPSLFCTRVKHDCIVFNGLRALSTKGRGCHFFLSQICEEELELSPEDLRPGAPASTTQKKGSRANREPKNSLIC